jgi:WD40 repeat protein
LLQRTLIGAASLDGRVMIWDIESQKSCARMDGHAFRVTDITFSPDESKLVSVSCESIRVWDAETGSLLAFLDDMDLSIECMTFSDGG